MRGMPVGPITEDLLPHARSMPILGNRLPSRPFPLNRHHSPTQEVRQRSSRLDEAERINGRRRLVQVVECPLKLGEALIPNRRPSERHQGFLTANDLVPDQLRRQLEPDSIRGRVELFPS
jgi:hypothetical protein